jgi:hypothetical protein
MDSLANALGLNADAPDAGSGKTGNLSTLVPDTTSLATVRQAEAVSKLEAAKATADEATEDLAVGGACDIWYLATGADGGRGRDADWDAIKKSGVQHFKMVLPEPEEAPYIWDKDPELREVRRLYEYGFAELFDIGGDDGDATDRPAERGYFFSSAEKVLSSDLIFYCLKGGVYVDFRHHPEPTRWVRAHLEPGDMLQVPEGALYRFSLPTATTVNKAAGHIGPKTTGTTPGTQIVVLTKEAPSAATMKVPLTLDALARYEAQHGEPHPSVQRYRHLFARPKVTGLGASPPSPPWPRYFVHQVPVYIGPGTDCRRRHYTAAGDDYTKFF